MITGVIPIGGKGTRLGLPFSKEMLPQPGLNSYNPVAYHIVKKMIMAGASEIVFVHGVEVKKDVVQFFNGPLYKHVTQSVPGFANTLYDGTIAASNPEKILFGLPDSIFQGNPFSDMVLKDGIVCGLFTTNDESKVDRLAGNNFDVKQVKTNNNSNKFWGVLKFDKKNIDQFVADKMFEKHSEIGHILNEYDKSMVEADAYLDLGTWSNYNIYIKEWV